jgi:hypothetical protein
MPALKEPKVWAPIASCALLILLFAVFVTYRVTRTRRTSHPPPAPPRAPPSQPAPAPPLGHPPLGQPVGGAISFPEDRPTNEEELGDGAMSPRRGRASDAPVVAGRATVGEARLSRPRELDVYTYEEYTSGYDFGTASSEPEEGSEREWS